MKKLMILLTVAAIAFTSLAGSEAQAAPRAKAPAVRHLKKANQRLKHKVKRLRHRLHERGGHKKNAA